MFVVPAFLPPPCIAIEMELRLGADAFTTFFLSLFLISHLYLYLYLHLYLYLYLCLYIHFICICICICICTYVCICICNQDHQNTNPQLGSRITGGSKMSVVGCFGDCGFGSPPVSYHTLSCPQMKIMQIALNIC